MKEDNWQKELSANKDLPYYVQLVSEADHQLSAIKSGLAQSVLLRELRPSFLHWICELDKYIYHHGRRFSKHDHISFVNLFYDILLTPGLEFRLVKTISRVLCTLLVKKELLSREDLSLDWRALYELFCFVAFKSYEEEGLLLLTADLQQHLEKLIVHCRTYFTVDSTQEILDELRPRMCPWDMEFVRAAQCLSLFLPTTLPPEHHDKGFKLWMEELLFWWINVQNSSPWELQFVHLFARLAHDTNGYIDWNPYLPEIFTRFLRSFYLVIGGNASSQVYIGNTDKTFDINGASLWFASMLGGSSDALNHLDKLFKTLETYYHPSNIGPWTEKLMGFMHQLPAQICMRLHRERHKKPDWTLQLRKRECFLADKDLVAFVNAMLPSVMNAAYGKVKTDHAVSCIRSLSQMCPEIVVPRVLELLYPSLETLAEPHRLLQSLNCLVAVIVPVTRMKEFRSNVIPVMNSLLPGLDVNDIAKCMISFQVLSLFAAMIPIVDCSEAVHVRDDLTDEERELCSATATFEDFVLQLVDRILDTVEMCAQSHGQASSNYRIKNMVLKFSPEETVMKSGMYSVLRAIMNNCSTAIYQVILDKIFGFVSETILEGKITAEMSAELCCAAVKSNPCVALPRLLPFLHTKFQEFITEDVHKEEEVNDSIKWYITIFVQCMRCDGNELLKHEHILLEIIDLLLPLTAKEAFELLGAALEYLLNGLTSTYTLQNDSERAKYDSDFSDYLPIRHWGEPYDRDAEPSEPLIVWHIPCAAELRFAESLLGKYLQNELDRLNMPENLTKEEKQKSLTLVKQLFVGAAPVLPLMNDQAVPLVMDSLVDPVPATYLIDKNDSKITLNGQNVRLIIFGRMHVLQQHILEKAEDDTQSSVLITTTLSLLLFYRGFHKVKFDQQFKGFTVANKILTNKVIGKKSQIRNIVIETALVQHHKRMLERSGYYFTETYTTVMKDLFQFATSHYSEVRIQAQVVLDSCFSLFPYSYKLILDDILSMLKKDESITHEQFKGALYILHGSKKKSLCSRNEWSTLLKIWPVLIRAQHSEKPSIIAILDSIHNVVVDSMESFQLEQKVTDHSCGLASDFWKDADSQSISPLLPRPADAEVEKAKLSESVKNDINLKHYNSLIQELVNLSMDTELHWRHVDMAQAFLSLLLRFDHVMPVEAVNVFVALLNKDSLKTRKMGIGSVGALLRLYKRKSVKVAYFHGLSGSEGAGDEKRPEDVNVVGHGAKWPIPWGFRPDNECLQYSAESVPKSAAMWNSTQFVEKTHWGYYSWPKELLIHTAPSKQPKLDRNVDEMISEERPLFEFFNSDVSRNKFVQLLSIEEKKGEDSFHTSNYNLFKGLTANFGPDLVTKFKPEIETLAKSDKEHDQRVVAEFVAGVVQGSKRWDFDQTVAMWDWIGPILDSGIERITSESMKDWGTSIATIFDSRDPRRLYWAIELLMAHVSRPVESSFQASTRLFLLQGGINQQEWRVISVWNRLLEICRPMIVQPYQNLRERLGSCLATIFWFDIPGISVTDSTKPPNRAKFLAEISSSLGCLWSECETGSPDEVGTNGVSIPASAAAISAMANAAFKSGDSVASALAELTNSELKSYTSLNVGKSNVLISSGDDAMEDGTSESLDVNGDRNNAILLFKTVLCYLNTHWLHAFESAPPDVIHFLPLLCYFENETSDDELKRDAKVQLLQMGRALMMRKNIDYMLDLCLKASKCSWWKARVSLLHFLQINVFSNYFLFSHNQLLHIEQILFSLLKDTQVEVQQAASQTLSGFFHCALLEVTPSLTNQFLSLCREAEPVLRHAGVLGLAAIVQSCPYTVPKFLPDVLMDLSHRASDPQPINGTVKKALSEFKRTHLDSWHEHKQLFTDDQLTVLTELLVSPNYYV